MFKMRWLTIITILILLFPTQAALAGRGSIIPTVSVIPFSVTVPVNSVVLYKVNISNIPNGGIHCAKVDLRVPNGYKIFPATGYSIYHIYSPTTLDFKVKVPPNAQRKFFNARVTWSRDYACHSIRTTNNSNLVEIIVTQ
jgi:hypothetical protein